MHNLIYISSASLLFTNEELIDILTISRRNNTRRGITGMLLYSEGAIFQILEGKEEVILEVYHKISQDPRHKGIIKMYDSSVQERNFKDWSMGFKQISKEDWSKLEGYLNLDNKNDFSQVANSGSMAVTTLIKTFAYVNMNMRVV